MGFYSMFHPHSAPLQGRAGVKVGGGKRGWPDSLTGMVIGVRVCMIKFANREGA